jgi:hypothetical protein
VVIIITKEVEMESKIIYRGNGFHF